MSRTENNPAVMAAWQRLVDCLDRKFPTNSPMWDRWHEFEEAVRADERARARSAPRPGGQAAGDEAQQALERLRAILRDSADSDHWADDRAYALAEVHVLMSLLPTADADAGEPLNSAQTTILNCLMRKTGASDWTDIIDRVDELRAAERGAASGETGASHE